MRVLSTGLLLFAMTLSLGMTALYFLSARYVPLHEESRGDDLATLTDGLLRAEERAELRREQQEPSAETAAQAAATQRRHRILGFSMAAAACLQSVSFVLLWASQRRRVVLWLVLAALLLIGATQVVDAVSVPGLAAAAALGVVLLLQAVRRLELRTTGG